MNESSIRELVEQWAAQNDCFLVDLKISTSKIKVFIDSAKGVSISTCSALSRYLAAELEQSELLETHDLEVSSPGIDQPFKVRQQFEKALGKTLKIVDREGKEKTAELTQVKENSIVLKEQVKEKEGKKKVLKEIFSEISFDEIKEAKEKLIF